MQRPHRRGQRAGRGAVAAWILMQQDLRWLGTTAGGGYRAADLNRYFAKLGIKEASEDNRRVLAVLTYLRR